MGLESTIESLGLNSEAISAICKVKNRTETSRSSKTRFYNHGEERGSKVASSGDDGGAHRGLHRKTEEEAHRGLHRKTEEEASRRRIGIRGLCVNQEEEKRWSCCSGGGEQETP